MEKIDLLRQIPLFKDLTDADLQKISEITREVTFAKGQRVFTEGSIGDSLFVIADGLVRVLKKGRIANEEVSTLKSGQHFGEMALIDDGPRSTTIEAVENTQLLEIKREELESLLAMNLEDAYRIYQTMAKYLCLRLRQTTKEFAFSTEMKNLLNDYIYQY